MGIQHKLFTSILSLALFSLSACSGGGDDDSSPSSRSISLSAVIDGSYNVAYTPTVIDHVKDLIFGERAIAVSSGTVDRVVAIPTWQGSYGPASFDSMVTADVENDGSFNLNLTESYEWVVLLTDSSATSVTDKVAAYVVLTVDASENLVAFSGSTIASSVDLGTLSKSGNEAQSSRTAEDNSSSFNLTLNQLSSLARSDDGYKHLINLYLNYNPVTKASYAAQLQYGWKAGAITDVGNKDPQATTIDSYQPEGFDITIETAVVSEELKDGICGMTTAIELIPPGDLISADGSITWTSASGFKNDGSGSNSTDLGYNNLGADNSSHWYQNDRYYCYDDDFSAQITSDFSNSLIGFGSSLNIQIPITGMPEGLWIYNVGGTDVAWFDLAVSSPVSAPGVFDTTPIPGIRLNHNNDDEITGIVVKWFQYDAALSQYIELTDEQTAAIDSLVGNTFIDIMDEDGSDPYSNPETIHLYPTGAPEIESSGLIDGSSIVFPTGTGAWLMPNSTNGDGNLIPTHIRIGMHMGGSLYNFSWN